MRPANRLLMCVQDVIYSRNAFGRPIEVHIIETDLKLCIKLRDCCNSKLAIHDNLPSRRISPLITTNGDTNIIRTNGDGNNFSNGQANGLSHRSQRLVNLSHAVENDPSDYSILNYDGYKLKTSMILTLTILLLLTLTLKRYYFLSILPSSSILTIALIYIFYTSNQQVTEESLIILKNSTTMSNIISKNLQESHNTNKDPDIADGYFMHIKKYRFKKPERKVLPIDQLEIRENLNGRRILYNLVVRLDFSNSTSLGESAKKEPVELARNQFEFTPATDSRIFVKGVDEIVLFRHKSPKLDCLEQILSKMKTFQQH